MAYNRSNSPDKYIRMTKNLQDRVLTKEEKLMLLNVYGVLRKEFRLSEIAAATKAANLCGVSTRALLSVKNEFGTGNISLPSLSPSEPSKKFVPPEKNYGDSRNRPEQKPSYHVYSLVKTKILELYAKGGITTMESVIEAFRKDPQLPQLEDSAIIQVIKLLNLTSHLAPASDGLQHNKGPSFKALAHSPEGPTSVRKKKATAHRNTKVDDECSIVYCQSDGSHVGAVDPLQLLEVKTDEADTGSHVSNEKIEDSMVVVKCELDKECSDRTRSNLDGIFPNRPTDSELQLSAFEYGNSKSSNIFLQFGSSQSNRSNSDAFLPIVQSRPTLMASEAKTVNSNVSINNITGDDSYAFATENQQFTSLTSVNNTPQPYAGILVYGLNETSRPIPNSFSFGTNIDSPSTLHYINNVSTDDSSNSTGILLNSPSELTNENVSNSLLVSSSQCLVNTASTSVTRPDNYASLPKNITNQLVTQTARPESRRTILRKLSRTKRYDKWCNLCHRMFDKRGSVCEHLSAGRKPLGEGSLTCKYCLKDFPKHTADDFIQHLMNMHTMTSLKCDFCFLLFGDAQNLVQHVIDCHKILFLEQQA